MKARYIVTHPHRPGVEYRTAASDPGRAVAMAKRSRKFGRVNKALYQVQETPWAKELAREVDR